MAKYIPHEKMTLQQIQAEIDCEFQDWNKIACSGCQDPGFPDGVNMNLIRNHIIYWYRLMDEKQRAKTQISLFDSQPQKRRAGQSLQKFQHNIWLLDVNILIVWMANAANRWYGG